MQTPVEPIFQFVGEAIQPFAWRIDTAFGGDLPPNVLARKIIRGMVPSLLWNLPANRRPWTLEELFWYGDHLDQFLPKSDPYWTVHSNPYTLPDFQLTCLNENTAPPRAERKSPPESVKCHRCLGVGHFARSCKLPRVKKSIIKSKFKKIRV